MGCDIHCYIEYREREKLAIKGGEENDWQSFGGRINPGRNYILFGLMSGIRSYGESDRILFKVKGLPEDIGYYARDDNFLYITADRECGHEDATSEDAARWVKNGSSYYKNGPNGKPMWVSNPDWHSHSWLNLAEYRQVLDRYKVLEQKDWEHREKERLGLIKHSSDGGLDIKEDSWLYAPCEHYDEPEYHVIEAVMAKFEEMGYESRLVFWFDN